MYLHVLMVITRIRGPPTFVNIYNSQLHCLLLCDLGKVCLNSHIFLVTRDISSNCYDFCPLFELRFNIGMKYFLLYCNRNIVSYSHPPDCHHPKRKVSFRNLLIYENSCKTFLYKWQLLYVCCYGNRKYKAKVLFCHRFDQNLILNCNMYFRSRMML